MFTQYFGNYLYESNIISLEQFRDALQQIKEKRAKLGVLAMEAGYMTPSQVEDTFAMQMQVDKRFGEIAIEKGYMTSIQLENILGRQSSPFSVFSQIMIDSGYMTYTELSEHLEHYRKKCGMSNESFIRFQNDDVMPIVEQLIVGYSQRDVIIKSYVEVFLKNIMRFISDNVIIGKADASQSHEGEWISCQKMTGTQRIISSFSGNEEAMLYLAGKFAKAEYTEFNLLVQDILGEFLNCNNGIFTANALEYHIDLNLEPQYVTNDFTSALTGDMFSIQFSVDKYIYQLNLAF